MDGEYGLGYNKISDEAILDTPSSGILEAGALNDHIRWMANSKAKVTIRVGKQAYQAQIGEMRSERISLKWELPIFPPKLKLGQTIQVTYSGLGKLYLFNAPIRMVDDDGILLETPQGVEWTERRQSLRRSLETKDQVQFRISSWPEEPMFLVHDLAMQGLSLLNILNPIPHPGEHLVGELLIPTYAAIPMVLEVAHINLHQKQVRLGVHIHEMTPADHQILWAYISVPDATARSL